MHQELIQELAVITEEEQKILDGRREIDQQIYTEKKEMIVDSSKLLKKGKLIQVRPHTRFVHFPPHTHNYIEVIYMCQGSTTHIVNGNKVILEQGDLLFLNQNAVQEILPAGKDDIAVNFIVLPEFFNTAFSLSNWLFFSSRNISLVSKSLFFNTSSSTLFSIFSISTSASLIFLPCLPFANIVFLFGLKRHSVYFIFIAFFFN